MRTSTLLPLRLVTTIAGIIFLHSVAMAQATRQEFMERLSAVSKEDNDAFTDIYSAGLAKLGSPAPTRFDAGSALLGMNGLWQGNKLNRSAFENTLERLRNVAKEPTERFRSTLTKSGQTDVDAPNAMLWLVQVDWIFKSNDLNLAEFDRFLGRIGATPLAAMDQWGATSDPTRGRYEAAVELAGFGNLYGQSGFKNDVFQKKLATRTKN